MTPSTLSTVRRAILIVLDEHGEVQGTETLALEINAPKNWTITQCRRMQSAGEITIIPSRGGRGLKTVYKRNRNSPGQPRRTR